MPRTDHRKRRIEITPSQHSHRRCLELMMFGQFEHSVGALYKAFSYGSMRWFISEAGALRIHQYFGVAVPACFGTLVEWRKYFRTEVNDA